MALTAVTTFDVAGNTQSIIFNNPSQIDQISYASGAITFASCSLYNLSKADFALYYQYKLAFYNLLFANFNTIGSSLKLAWPVPGTEFLVNTTNPPERVVYTYNSIGTLVLNASYLPIANTVTFSARPSPVTVTLQEFFSNIDVLGQFATQVAAS